MEQAKTPMRWIPTLYFVQGMQFFVVMLIAGLMFKNLGVANDQIARWTAVLGLAWAVKPLWSPFLELARSKKLIVTAMQYLGAVGLGLMALALHLPHWFGAAIIVLFLIAYASATHDIACDGLYMASLDSKRQAAYAGWQGAFFNGARFFITGIVLKLAGHLEGQVGVVNAWSSVFLMLCVLVTVLATYNAKFLPGTLSTEHSDLTASGVAEMLKDVVIDFFKKPGIWLAVLFIVLFRLAEGQVQTIGPLFLLEARDKGGLGLTTGQVADVYGWVGTGGFLIGSVLGGYLTSALGLKRAMPLLLVAMMVPNFTFYYLASTLPQDMLHIGAAVGTEMLGYGFGFVGMILYIMQAVAPGRYQTAHYALGSGVMQLGFIFAKFISGDIQVSVGYQHFFAWTIGCGVLPLLLLFWVPMPRTAKPAEAVPA
ncbi:MFS transporter [Roseateles sp. BYS78W]|uniref:MFS transporter n=1 Tax=Pelomonas candidula TaxID=3299025 RepID=A0ABW7HJH0_9BURK